MSTLELWFYTDLPLRIAASQHPDRSRDRSILRRCSGPYVSWSAFYFCRPGLRFVRGSAPRASSTTAA